MHLDVVIKNRGSSIACVRYELQARRRVLRHFVHVARLYRRVQRSLTAPCPPLATSIRENRVSVYHGWPRSSRRLPRPARKREARGSATSPYGVVRPGPMIIRSCLSLHCHDVPLRSATIVSAKAPCREGDVEPRVEAGRSKCGIAEKTGNVDSRAWVGDRFPGMATSIREADQYMIWRISGCDGDDAPAAHLRNSFYFDRCCRGRVPVDDLDVARLGPANVIRCH